MKILGIDPSIRRTGWGIIDSTGEQLTHIAHGVIQTLPKFPPEERIFYISNEIMKIVKEYAPTVTCIEETYCGINPITTLRLGYTSGAILSNLASIKMSIFKYPTKIVKQLIANKGSSSKDQVEERVMEILGISHIDNQDSSDALAVALTYVFDSLKPKDDIIIVKPKKKKKTITKVQKKDDIIMTKPKLKKRSIVEAEKDEIVKLKPKKKCIPEAIEEMPIKVEKKIKMAQA